MDELTWRRRCPSFVCKGATRSFKPVDDSHVHSVHDPGIFYITERAMVLPFLYYCPEPECDIVVVRRDVLPAKIGKLPARGIQRTIKDFAEHPFSKEERDEAARNLDRLRGRKEFVGVGTT